jgi:hypothetical protein
LRQAPGRWEVGRRPPRDRAALSAIRAELTLAEIYEEAFGLPA